MKLHRASQIELLINIMQNTINNQSGRSKWQWYLKSKNTLKKEWYTLWKRRYSEFGTCTVNQNTTLFTLATKKMLRKSKFMTVPNTPFSGFTSFLEYTQTDNTVCFQSITCAGCLLWYFWCSKIFCVSLVRSLQHHYFHRFLHTKKQQYYTINCFFSDWEGPAPRTIVAFKRKMVH